MATGMSVHIGLNSVDPAHYNGWDGTLKACEYDAHDMEALARSRSFEPTVLLTKEGTADAVKGAISNAAENLSKDDIFFISYSGHGGQVPDTNSDEEGDDTDETWVLYDRQLVDDELHALWASFKPGVRIFVLSDSCHSGSVTRGLFEEAVPSIVKAKMVDDDQPRTKDLPRAVQDETYRANERLYQQIQSDNPDGDSLDLEATVVLISGCQDNQLSLDGARNGLFTQNLKAAWGDGGFRGGYKKFWKAIGANMPPQQSPNYYVIGPTNRSFERQRPFTVG